MPAQRIYGYIEDMLNRFHWPVQDKIVLNTCAGLELSWATWYDPLFKGANYFKHDIADTKPPSLDYICDICTLNNFTGLEYADFVLNMESLSRIYNPQRAVDILWDICKFDGICLLTTVCHYPYRPSGPKRLGMRDYWRFTPRGVVQLFRRFQILNITAEGKSATQARGIWITAKKVRNWKAQEKININSDPLPIKLRHVPLNYPGWIESARRRKAKK